MVAEAVAVSSGYWTSNSILPDANLEGALQTWVIILIGWLKGPLENFWINSMEYKKLPLSLTKLSWHFEAGVGWRPIFWNPRCRAANPYIWFCCIKQTDTQFYQKQAVYDFKLFSSTAIWAIWIWRYTARLNLTIAMYFNNIKKTEKFQWPCGLREFKIS